ncbi:4-hydroxythreonine-4-phosphate dehydrogenase [Helicobacter cholecystus]|uniref:4-hydroxythreonine-4-phosphate dehydrogenase n=1 Tax=Helicobacter cholecystus TaxID=45498 RepID=A0A3D8IUT6_9HELI|nr:4-hydroxythreonine-4-phosphate dehydrogenase [Helicobacter cholecystus]RDU69049.1 4-hydroxythreonine-4-phosphate dehydrogenase [Helicobacter cholecystus]VEJ24579.1 4-hydroxythreonine-4-phosphate dehydrogenase [Helicobacter cholecystus]
MKQIAISCGDINGVGLEILLKAHESIIQTVTPIYCVHYELLELASSLLSLPFPPSLTPSMCQPPKLQIPKIEPKVLSKESGRYSYESFILGCKLSEEKKTDALVTLPIHKQAWLQAGIKAIGHTQALALRYNKEAIMMLGWEKMFIALYTDHIPLREVSSHIKSQKLFDFFKALYASHPQEKYCVMGFNPHAGDGGMLGNEEKEIQKAIERINLTLGKEVFKGVYPPDCSFIPARQKEFRTWIAMYHDIGLATLKALYFNESINVSLNIPILRASVDHGVAFDIAYNGKASIKSYLNAIAYVASR